MAKIFLNGEPQEVNLPINIAQLLVDNNVSQLEMVSVQVNEEYAERDDWHTIELKDGDSVDFLYFMGGGTV